LFLEERMKRMKQTDVKQSKEEYKKYKVQSLLGSGKTAKTFLVTDKFGYEYALKQYKKTKSINKILQEVAWQRRCSDVQISPKIIDVDTKGKFIVMEKMDYFLLDEINFHKTLSTARQKELVAILQKLDKIGIFHGDANLLNLMIKNNRLYIIDFDMSKEIDEKLISSMHTSTPNLFFMILAVIANLKLANVNPSTYTFLQSVVAK
jgi:serine/threonine protein kinase